MNPKKPRIVRPEDEDRRTANPAASTGEVNGPPLKPKRESGEKTSVESLPDGEEEAGREAARARDD
jgi:hypothetical protein